MSRADFAGVRREGACFRWMDECVGCLRMEGMVFGEALALFKSSLVGFFVKSISNLTSKIHNRKH
jgi:hypothetical protein